MKHWVTFGVFAWLLMACQSGGMQPPPSPGPSAECSSDADCVPATCCHPTACVAKSRAPDCRDVACTLECRAGTLDCNQGHCACSSGRCGAVLTP